MSNEIKEFYDLDELTTLLSRNLNIDIENKKELSEVIFKLISKNHLTPYLEYRGLVGDVESYISYASYQIIETLLYTLEPTNLNGNVSESSNLYNYNPTLNSIKNLVRTFEHGYSTKPSQIEYKTHAIFRLSPLSIINTVDGIQVELGFDKPVAHIKKFIDYPIKNNEHEFYGYQLYRSKQVDTPKLKINDTCKLVFSRFDIEYFINS
ncbi:hypothetical protein CXF61_04830, partial [Psychrobacter sp. 4Dc]|uniref:hypothetical protein n=1 Tax=Psychrobacter sp. 4Dc TaxID=888437 RepID=UPI000CCA14F4